MPESMEPPRDSEQQEQLDVTFEIARPEDWKKLAAIRLEALKRDPKSFIGRTPLQTPDENNEAGWKAYLESQGQFFVFAKIGNEIVGFAGAEYLREDLWYMKWGYVRSGVRGHRVGYDMFKRVLEEIGGRKGERVIGKIVIENENYRRVKNLLEELDFMQVPNRFAEDDGLEITMLKKLQQHES